MLIRAHYREVRKVTLIGSAVDLVLGIFKLIYGYSAQSQALIADGFHSISDLLTDALVLFASRAAHREADEEHPYGHGRIETAATVGLGFSLIAVGVGISADAVQRLFEPQLLLRPTVEALYVAAISVVLKEAVYHYTLRSARKLGSELLRANAWHSRSDALSSGFVIVGVAGSMAGLAYVDAIAAVAVAVMIVRIGWRLAWSNIRELIDTGLDPAQLHAIERAILGVEGVAALHMLRTRRMAGKALVDVHILLNDARLSVSEGHQISETARARLIESIDEVADVTVHIDPEDDEVTHPNNRLPLRDTALARLDVLWRDVPQARNIRDVRLHYLNGQLHVEVVLPLAEAERAVATHDALDRALTKDPDFGLISLVFQ